jgi:uncharacterized protein (DUF2249 family)
MDIDKIRERFSGADHAERTMPPELAQLDAGMITDLDVRDDLRRGQEPFSRIMAVQQAIAPGAVLRLRAIFEPVPLYAALARFGFAHWTRKISEDDWEVWFYRGSLTETEVAPAQQAMPAPVPSTDNATIVLDVRGLEPPEPMQRTLEMLETLPVGGTLMQINSRVPQFLLPLLEERGFEYTKMSEAGGVVTGLIRRNQEK